MSSHWLSCTKKGIDQNALSPDVANILPALAIALLKLFAPVNKLASGETSLNWLTFLS